MMNSKETLSSDQELLVGIDVGSTTTKIVAVDPEQEKILYSKLQKASREAAQKCHARG